jgi:uncharacterized protein
MQFLYIHGFASSPQSRKAAKFRSALAGRGIQAEIPAMDRGDFEHLTISGQLNLLEDTIDGKPVCLIGSSMGGFLAALYASMHPEVSRLVLLAPAFGFARRSDRKMGEPKPAAFEVFHYGDNCLRRVHYGLIEDALRFPDAPDFVQPALIVHGVHDDVVPIGYSRDFAARHPSVRLVELDSDHELLNVLDRITVEAIPFLVAGDAAP